MFSRLYAEWMTEWETRLTTRDTNRIVRPLEWGFDWLETIRATELAHAAASRHSSHVYSAAVQTTSEASELDEMIALNQQIVGGSQDFFSYETPQDFRLEERLPELFPTNVRPETLAHDAEIKRRARAGQLEPAKFLRFTSPVRTNYPENDVVNARWYPAPANRQSIRSRQAIVVMPQWNADAFSHNALCALFNRFGISALRLSKPYHDIRRPSELERSDYAVSANIGRTIASCRQGVVDIRSCMDWLETQGYDQFGVLGTSLGSCYAFIAAAHDPRLRICAFNHAATWFGDVVWTGQSTRHIRASFEQAGLNQNHVREMFLAISPMAYMELFAASPRRVLVVHGTYDLTFLREFSLDVLENFNRFGVDYISKVLPCGHYTTGETPYKYLDGWYIGSFIYQAFKNLARQNARQISRIVEKSTYK